MYFTTTNYSKSYIITGTHSSLFLFLQLSLIFWFCCFRRFRSHFLVGSCLSCFRHGLLLLLLLYHGICDCLLLFEQGGRIGGSGGGPLSGLGKKNMPAGNAAGAGCAAAFGGACAMAAVASAAVVAAAAASVLLLVVVAAGGCGMIPCIFTTFGCCMMYELKIR